MSTSEMVWTIMAFVTQPHHLNSISGTHRKVQVEGKERSPRNCPLNHTCVLWQRVYCIHTYARREK